jgi:hypothetical protein
MYQSINRRGGLISKWTAATEHLIISGTGVMTSFTLTPANGSERDALWEMLSTFRGLLIGDKGQLSERFHIEKI